MCSINAIWPVEVSKGSTTSIHVPLQVGKSDFSEESGSYFENHITPWKAIVGGDKTNRRRHLGDLSSEARHISFYETHDNIANMTDTTSL